METEKKLICPRIEEEVLVRFDYYRYMDERRLSKALEVGCEYFRSDLDEVGRFGECGTKKIVWKIGRIRADGIEHVEEEDQALCIYSIPSNLEQICPAFFGKKREPVLNPCGPDKQATESLIDALSTVLDSKDVSPAARDFAKGLIEAVEEGYEIQSGEKYK